MRDERAHGQYGPIALQQTLLGVHVVGEYDDLGSERIEYIAAAGQPRGKPLRGRRLLDVQRLACCDATGRIDQTNRSETVTLSQLVGDGPSDATGTDDGCDWHGIVQDDRGSTQRYCSGMTTTPQLDGKVAIVTGGSSGIGLALASRLVAHGARVTIGGRRAARLAAARVSLERQMSSVVGSQHASHVETCQVDVRDPDQVQRMVDATVASFGGVDILMNNAGVGIFAEALALSVEQWREVLDTNLSGVFHCCRSAIPELKRRGGGWIINISSLASKNPFPGGAAYCASKAGLNAFSEALMQELRHDDIRVSYVLPGSTDTDFSRSGSGAGGWKLEADDVARTVVDLLAHDPRSLPSRVEIRPSKPRR